MIDSFGKEESCSSRICASFELRFTDGQYQDYQTSLALRAGSI